MNQSVQRPCGSLEQSYVSMKKPGQLVINILLYILLFFPITSFFKDKVSFLNPVLTGITFFLLFVYYFFKRFHFQQLLIAIYIIGMFLLNIVKWGFHYYNFNMLFYFPFLLLYFEFVKLEKDNILAFLHENKIYIDTILFIWNIVVFVSFFYEFFICLRR